VGGERRVRLVGLAAVAAGLLLVVTGASVAGAANPGELQAVPLSPVPAKEFGGDVRSLKPVAVKKRHEVELRLPKSNKAPSSPVQAGPATPAAPSMPATLQNFAGLSFIGMCGATQCGAGWPPDPVGDVGPNHYVEAVNTAVGIFSKSGAQLAAFTFDSLWSGAGSGTPCDTSNSGDPTVVYDQLADRWIVADLGFKFNAAGTTPVAPFYECIAVSKSGDPVGGGWYLYAVRTDPGGSGAPPSGYLNDYPKMGLWADGLYMTANEFDLNVASQPFKGVALWAFDRTAMEAGQPLKQLVAFTNNATDPVSVLPVNLRSALPPAGTPEYLVSESATAYAYEVRTFTVNWAAPSGVVSAPTNVSQAQYVVGAGAIVPQPADPLGGTGNLDAIDDRPMMQAQYRNLAGSESLWVAHAVRTSSSSPTGLQWAQLNVTGKTITTTPVQQQIFTNGNDGLWRWIPSLAVDGAGDMAVGYSTSSSANYPSIRYAGRLASDPANTLSQAEATLQTGLGSQTVSTRWGDYSAMTVDPTDNCTFWYVNEYYAGPGDGTVLYAMWSTRIGSFKFPNCGSAALTPTNVVTNSTPTTLGSSITFTATVGGAGVTPTGTVTWAVGGTAGKNACTSSTTTLSGGTATCTITANTAGTYVVSDSYSGDSSYLAVGSNIDTVTVTVTVSAPTITGFTPTRGRVSTIVTITGTNFTTPLTVAFNTQPATKFTVVSGTQITATVPSGATSGPIKVTTSGGTATSAQVFRVR
jgi:Bacterial Ig-like domain (group 3)